MKIFGIICLLGIMISCGNKSVEKNINKEKTIEDIPFMIKIKKTNFNIITAYGIDCNEFDEWGNNHASFHIIENKDTINLIVDIIKHLERKSETLFVDVRTKILIFNKSHHTDTICMNKYLISINGETYLSNKKLVDIIEGL